ncbi:HTH_Tnp_Tc3_2 domain-containing protein [Trichonephila clavipes]|nr:HTH_Tnp_Tc3_2 domain-containing protein [Trichonephila clavipes]
MPRVRSRSTYQHVSDFNRGRIIGNRNCGLLYHSIAACVGRDPLTVNRIQNRWVQDGNTKCRAGSQRLPITSSREDRHVTHIALIDRAAISRALRQELGSFARQQVSARTVEEDKSSNVQASTSVRRVAEALDLPRTTAQKIMRNILRCYPYKLQLVQELLPHDFETRHLFALQFLARIGS